MPVISDNESDEDIVIPETCWSILRPHSLATVPEDESEDESDIDVSEAEVDDSESDLSDTNVVTGKRARASRDDSRKKSKKESSGSRFLDIEADVEGSEEDDDLDIENDLKGEALSADLPYFNLFRQFPCF